MVASDGDSSVVGVLLFGWTLQRNLGVHDFFSSVIGIVLVFDDKESFSAFNAFVFCVSSHPDALAQASHFVVVVFDSGFGTFGIILKLVLLKLLDPFFVKDWHFPVGNEISGELLAGCISCSDQVGQWASGASAMVNGFVGRRYRQGHPWIWSSHGNVYSRSSWMWGRRLCHCLWHRKYGWFRDRL